MTAILCQWKINRSKKQVAEWATADTEIGQMQGFSEMQEVNI